MSASSRGAPCEHRQLGALHVDLHEIDAGRSDVSRRSSSRCTSHTKIAGARVVVVSGEVRQCGLSLGHEPELAILGSDGVIDDRDVAQVVRVDVLPQHRERDRVGLDREHAPRRARRDDAAEKRVPTAIGADVDDVLTRGEQPGHDGGFEWLVEDRAEEHVVAPRRDQAPPARVSSCTGSAESNRTPAART